jgi:ribosome biogenesis SPOUT family RNA methylase Rps3
MDLRGKEILTPIESENLEMVIIGGILGDHPPRDRTSSLRQNNVEMKHLGDL